MAGTTANVAGFVTVLCFLGFLYRQITRRKPPAPFPPGPIGLPLLGNVLDLPKSQSWVAFSELGKKYGGIVHLSALGKSIVVLNEPQHAIDMLEKKGRLYSDRPVLTMAGSLVGWDQGPALSHPGHHLSEIRRLLAQLMGTRTKVAAYNAMMEDSAHTFLKNVLSDPLAWPQHAHHFAGAIVLDVAYGYKSKAQDDPLVKLVEEAVDQFSETTATGAFLVDVFPILRFVPEWFPGAAWKKKAHKYQATLQDMLDSPYNWTKQQMATGAARPCFISDQLENRQVSPDEEYIIKWAAAGIYSGGADTTVAGIESFVLAMTFHTEQQRKAQLELASVLGAGILPMLVDRARLPYCEALFTEVLRTYTFAPLGLPHVATRDDVHNGYFIPEGTIVLPNVWQFFRNSTTYANPEIFSPERFIESEGRSKEQDPRDYLFGFGRRACPGIHFADAEMWLVCISMIAAFEIRPPVKDGKPIFPTGKYKDGTISHPEPFDCVITPRAGASEAINRAVSASDIGRL